MLIRLGISSAYPLVVAAIDALIRNACGQPMDWAKFGTIALDALKEVPRAWPSALPAAEQPKIEKLPHAQRIEPAQIAPLASMEQTAPKSENSASTLELTGLRPNSNAGELGLVSVSDKASPQAERRPSEARR